jgi:CheY-like chemotaxis protein
MAKERIRVLIADDEFSEIVARGLRLINPSYDFWTYADGASVLRDLGRGDLAYDVAIIDRELPGVEGDAVISKLKEKNPDKPVIAFSCYANNRVSRRGAFVGDVGTKNLEADGYLRKPVRIEKVDMEIQRVLGLA